MPSQAARSTDYNKHQGTNAAILDGRFNIHHGDQTAAPPIQLYDRVFGAFSVRVQDPNLTAPEDFLRRTAKLLRSVSGISIEEASRDEETREILAQILDLSFERVDNQDNTASDYMSVHPTPFNVNAAPIIVQVKGELGTSGDPSVHLSFSYARFYCLGSVSRHHLPDPRITDSFSISVPQYSIAPAVQHSS